MNYFAFVADFLLFVLFPIAVVLHERKHDQSKQVHLKGHNMKNRAEVFVSKVTDIGNISPEEVGDFAYVFIPEKVPGQRIGCVRFLDDGYISTDFNDAHMTRDQVDSFVAKANEKLGIPSDVVEAMHCGSMFGWHVPAARRALEFFAGQQAKVTAKAA